MLARLEATQFAAWMRSNSLFGWPVALTIHAFGTALVIGFMFIISLRVLGLFETIPYRAVNRMFPVVWIAILLQFLSGFALWMAKPTRYVDNVAFLLKFSLVVIGIVLTLYAFGIIRRDAASWEAKGAGSSRGAKLVALTLLVWCFVLVAGRMTAYLGSI